MKWLVKDCRAGVVSFFFSRKRWEKTARTPCVAFFRIDTLHSFERNRPVTSLLFIHIDNDTLTHAFRVRKMDVLTTKSVTVNLIWENLSVYIDGTRSYNALDKVRGYARSGHILAVMGPSLSGKTTLVRLLSGRTIRRPLIFNSKNGLIYLNQQRVTDRQILIENSACADAIEDTNFVVPAVTVHEHLLFQVRIRARNSLILSLGLLSRPTWRWNPKSARKSDWVVFGIWSTSYSCRSMKMFWSNVYPVGRPDA